MESRFIICAAVWTFIGCGASHQAAVDDSAAFPSVVWADQEYDLDYVKKRMRQVRPGMRRTDVLIILGRPKEIWQNTWIYQPEALPAFKAFDTVVVTFDGDRVLKIEKSAAAIGVGNG